MLVTNPSGVPEAYCRIGAMDQPPMIASRTPLAPRSPFFTLAKRKFIDSQQLEELRRS